MHQIIPVNLFLVSFVFGFFQQGYSKVSVQFQYYLDDLRVNRSPWMPSVYFNLIFNTSLPSVPAVAATMEGNLVTASPGERVQYSQTIGYPGIPAEGNSYFSTRRG
ncbi:MAG: hypothetical protein IPJ09_21120 [Saprospiraceae bacterium]|nr:hypothetical protein [Saprospiraceae bacterium]